MATSYKVLGQSAPASTTPANLYTAPSLTSAVCSTLAVCNRGATATFRVSVRPAGTSQANQHYIVYDSTVNANDSIFITVGITLAPSDVVTVYASTGDVSFSLFGSEIS